MSCQGSVVMTWDPFGGVAGDLQLHKKAPGMDVFVDTKHGRDSCHMP